MSRVRPNRRRAPKRERFKAPALPRPVISSRALSALMLAAGIVVVCLMVGRELFKLPLRKLEIEGSFQRVTKFEIEAAVKSSLNGSFLALDLEAIQRRIAAISWIDNVTLRRVWPDTLRIVYREQHAAARWGEDGLLNTRGELFALDGKSSYVELPQLAGPEGSHRSVASRYLAVRDRLPETGLRLQSISMDARGALTITLTTGLSVRIGREDVDVRIERLFNAAIPALADDLERASYIDMRYPNGFAVGWRDPAGPEGQMARLETGG